MRTGRNLRAASSMKGASLDHWDMRTGRNYNGYVSFNETPTLTKGQVMQVTATFSLQGRPVRY